MHLDTARDRRPKEAILLVAGTGSRLLPLTESCPKCLLDVGGKPLLRRLLEQLVDVGMERVVLATGYLAEKLLAAVADWELDLEIRSAFCETYGTENNAVSLAAAINALESRRFLLCDGDILLRKTQGLERLLDCPGDNVLTMMRFEKMGDEEMKIALDKRGDEDEPRAKIAALGKGLEQVRAAGESLGIQKIGPTAFAPLQKRLAGLNVTERKDLYYEDVFSELIADGIDFYACDLPLGGWTEIDTVDDLDKARQMARNW